MGSGNDKQAGIDVVTTPPADKAGAVDVAPAGHSRWVLVVAFDGANYAGWQWQPADVSVQQRLEEALGRLFPTGPRVHSSSRTDAGVHGRGMVAHFDAPNDRSRMPGRKLVLAINAHLPEDIRVMSARRVRGAFHARFTAAGKQYRYHVWNHPAHDPMTRLSSWHVTRPLDVGAMRAAAATLVGTHDFLAFSASPGYEREHTVRTIRQLNLRKSGDMITFIIEADGFLYKMCRGLVGTLVQVGLGRFKPEEVRPMLVTRNRSLAGMTAPAHGLVLWKVYYPRKGGAGAPRRTAGKPSPAA